MMFVDPALAAAARHALSWSPPTIVQPTGLFDRSTAYREEANKVLDELDRRLAQWLEEGESIRAQLREAVARIGMTEELCSALEMFVGLVEEKALQTSRDSHSLLDGMRRHIREVTDLKAEERAVANLVLARLEKSILRELDERTDFALFLRALIAECDPDAREGTVFDSPDDLRRHLKAVTAS
jgi:hypothetical protein